MSEAEDKLESYLRNLITQGIKIPSRENGVKPHFGAISARSGVSYRYLLTQPLKQRITLATQEIGLASPQDSRALKLKRDFEKSCELLSNYLKWLEDNGLKLPEEPTRKGEVFLNQVEIESGIGRNTLRLKGTGSDQDYKIRLIGMIDNVTSRIGTEVRVLPQSPCKINSPITNEQLLIRGTAARKRELQGKAGSRQQLYNTRSALKRFIKELNLGNTSPVGDDLNSDFEQAIDKVIDTIKSKGTEKKFQTEIRWWRDFYQQLIKEQSIPSDFHMALVYLIDRSGLHFSLLAKLLDVSTHSLKIWYQGETTPSRSSYPAISRMESMFKLPAGTLISKITIYSSNRRFRTSQFPEFLRQDKPLARKVTRYLPDDFCELQLERQKETVQAILADILQDTDPFTRKLIELFKLPYKLKEWPQKLEEEFNELAVFKMGERPPLGMRRNGKWRYTTKEKIRKDLNFLFGALRLPSNAEDERMRGLGVADEHLSLALLACPLIIDWFIRFRCEKRTQYTRYAIVLLEYVLAMLRPGTGWIRQTPRLASRLRPISYSAIELVSQELILKAQTDWNGVCDDARDYYRNLIKELNPLISIARDPFQRIEGIVELDKPLNGLKFLIKEMKNNLPNKRAEPMRYHCAIRNCTLVLLITMTGFRRATISQLNYTNDATGHLFLNNGCYWLNVPRSLFKEENAPFFGPKHAQKNYYMELPNVFGLNKMFDEYLKDSRPWLLSHYHQGCKEQPLFVTSARSKSVGISPILVSSIYKGATAEHLAENKWRNTGIPRVRAHGPHSARHIRGTDAVKRTGSIQIAGDANHNSERMAGKHYTRFLPKDRNKRVNDVLFGSEEDDVEDDTDENN